MRLGIIFAGLVLVASTIFALLNYGLVVEAREVRFPGGTAAAPLVEILLAAVVAAIFVMLAIHAVDLALRGRVQARLQSRLEERERELTEMKSRAYDEASARIDALREDLSRKFDTLHQALEGRAEGAGRPGGSS